MANNELHINWAERLEAYAAGKLSAPEMHELEMAAQQDPFLMDALEGYVMMARENKLDVAASVLNALPQKSDKFYEPEVVPLFSRKWLQWSVAAAVSLLVGIGLFNQINQVDEEPAIALNNQPEPVAETELPGTQELADSVAVPMPADLPQDIVRNADNLPKGKLPEKGEQKVKAEAVQPAPLMADEGLRTTTIAAEAPIIFRVYGKVIDEQNQEPIDNAVIELAGRQVISDPIGRFEVGAPALPADIRVGARGYRTKLFKWNQGDGFLQIGLQKLPPTTEEVVVTKMNATKNATGLVVIPNDTSQTAPIGGWQNFDGYFKQNMKAKGTSKIYKSVSMSFEIDASGTPTAIEVTQSPGEEAKAEAIRLLQNGPKWKRGRGDPPMATITVKY